MMFCARTSLYQFLRAAPAGLFLLVFLSFSVSAQSELVVRDIRVEGLQRISEGTVFNYLPINIGDQLDQSRVQEAIRAVYETEFFKDVEFRWDNGVLIIAVAERPSIEDFTITGNKDIKTEDLEEPLARIGLKAGRIFNRSVLDEVEQSLTDQYFSQGKYAAKVTTEVEELPDNKVSIAIKIKEGDRARIRQINIVGNTSFDDEELTDDFQLRTPHWLSWIKQDDRYSREALSGDLETLRSFYMDRGFADFRLESTQVAIAPDKQNIYITINLVEGERYKVSDVRLAGELILPDDQLNPYVQIKPGQIYSQRLITATTELIRLRLGEEGYAFATIEPVPELDRDAKTVAITLYVDPKNRVYVRRINFNGADSVNDEVFRREMRQFEGGYLSSSKVERSRIRLQRLPYVEAVEVDTNQVPGTADMVDVDFDIKEGLPGQFGGGVGFSESQGVVLNGTFVHTNFMGTGNRIAADINTGKYRTIYSASHTNPYSTINEVSRTVSFAYRDITNFTSDASDFDTTTFTAAVEFSYPLTEYQRLILGVSWNSAELLASQFSSDQAKEWVLNNGNQSRHGFDTVATDFDNYLLTIGWIYDTRNRSLFADRGSRHRFLVGVSAPSSDIDFYTVNYTVQKFWPLTRYFTLAFNGDASFGDSFSSTTSIPPYKRFFGGGPDSVRGYRENSLGPQDSFGNPYGGNAFIAGQTELILPIPEKWRSRSRFTAFYDFGGVYDTGGVNFTDKLGDPIEYDLDTDGLKDSWGLAVQWLAPLGLFRFSYAFPLNADDETHRFYGNDTERFQFSIGGAF
jgi:outer membrane protein insertion porin family